MILYETFYEQCRAGNRTIKDLDDLADYLANDGRTHNGTVVLSFSESTTVPIDFVPLLRGTNKIGFLREQVGLYPDDFDGPLEDESVLLETLLFQYVNEDYTAPIDAENKPDSGLVFRFGGEIIDTPWRYYASHWLTDASEDSKEVWDLCMKGIMSPDVLNRTNLNSVVEKILGIGNLSIKEDKKC